MGLLESRFLLAWVLALGACGLAQQAVSQPETDIRGWLSDEECARGRAEVDTFTATNPECARQCVAKGKKTVLIDPERKMIFEIVNRSLAKIGAWQRRTLATTFESRVRWIGKREQSESLL
jgi:hypothetical protein